MGPQGKEQAVQSPAAITWEVVQAEAERLGYEVSKTVGHILAIKKGFRHVNRALDLTEKFFLDPRRTELFSLLKIYYWMRCFEIDYGTDGKVELFLTMRHPKFQSQVYTAEYFDYESVAQLTSEMAEWVARIEGEE